MTRRAWGILLMVVGLAGCASGASTLRLAREDGVVCKHCNCYMPAGLARDAACPVCDCGYVAGACHRGR